MAVHLGTLIRRLREDAGLGVRDLAKRAGVDSGIISRLENHKQSSIKADSLASIAQVLGTTADALLHDAKELDDGGLPKREWPTLEQWLAKDRNLTDRQRQAILQVYEGYVNPR